MKLRWREILIALIMAVTLWYGMSGSEKVESQIDVRVDYKGTPQGLIVRSGMVNKISVRVRASTALLRSLSGREYTFSMDLSSVQKGENVLPIDLNRLPFWGAIEVMESTPSRVQLEVDSIESKRVALAPDVQGELPADYVVQTSFVPAAVSITGPATVLETIDAIRVPVFVDPSTLPGNTESKRALPLPSGVDSTPAEVSVSMHVGIKRKLVKVTRTVEVAAPATLGRFLRPDRVVISLAVPESQAAKAASNDDIAAFVTLEKYDLGSYTLPVHVRLPEGSEFVRVEPDRISVTLEQKQSPPAAKRK